jgi:hypothetical protein
VPSVKPRLSVPMAVGLAVALAGCVSTQTKNARLVIENERIIDGQSPVRVTRINPEVAVTRVALVGSPGHAAVAVSLQNLAGHPLSDLPISVGIARRRAARAYLNRAANLDYFDTHLAAMRAGATATWVLPLRRAKLPAGHLFAAVGFAQTPPSTRDRSLPTIDVFSVDADASGGLKVTVANRSQVPQTELPIYAVAVRAGRYVAAGRATIGQLGASARRTVPLRLRGASTGATIELFASPTIFN